MIKIKLSKHIYRDCKTNELGSWIHQYMKLPYPPFPGLIIHDGKGEIMEVKIVKYDKGEKVTYCYIEPEFHEDYENAKQCAKDCGWKLREVPPGKICKNPKNFF